MINEKDVLIEENEERVKIIVNIFKKKGINHRCRICNDDIFTLTDARFITGLENTDKGKSLLTIPIILITCDNCGHVRVHERDILGIPPKDLE